MGINFKYASFPNSRQRNRNPTVQAVTDQIEVFDYTLPATLISLGSLNRTYILIESFSQVEEVLYFYATTNAILNPTVTATFGVDRDLIYNPVGDILYQKQGTGTDTNWIIVNKQDVGQKIFQIQTAGLDSLQDIYAFYNLGVPSAAAPVMVGIDEGRG